MNRFANSPRIWLLLLISATIILFAGKAAGFEWPLSPKVAFGRLLIHPLVAAVEVLLASALLLLDYSNLKNKKWIVIVSAVSAVICGFYHLIFYFVGMEFLLIYGAMDLVRKYSRSV